MLLLSVQWVGPTLLLAQALVAIVHEVTVLCVCRNAVASAGIKHAMPLLSLLYQLDQQYSVVKSAPANLLHALLASSLLVDIIASHSSRLQDLLAQAQADSDNQIGAHKTAKSKRKAKQQQGKAFLTPVVDQAVEKWHERMQMPLAAQDKEARTSMLFDSLAIAALEYLQSQTLPGILTHAEKPAVKRLLAISWHSTSPHDMVMLTGSCCSISCNQLFAA